MAAEKVTVPRATVDDMALAMAAMRRQNLELLTAARLVFKSFGYRPGQGPDWYEATRAAVEAAERQGA